METENIGQSRVPEGQSDEGEDAAPAWELCKENVLPLKKGRDVRGLGGGAGGLRARKREPDVEEGQEQGEGESESEQLFEAALQAVDATEDAQAGEGDVLGVWWKYIQWSQKAHVSAVAETMALMERCTVSIMGSERWKARYADDERFVKIWILYADYVAQPHEVFRFLHSNAVGRTQAIFWIAWAFVAEKESNFKLADKVFQQGLRFNARPKDVLHKRYAQFQRRMSRYLLNQQQDREADLLGQQQQDIADAENDGENNAPSAALLPISAREARAGGGNRRSRVRPRAVQQQHQQRAPLPTTASASAGRKNAEGGLGFQIFDDAEDDGEEGAAETAEESKSSGAAVPVQAGWTHLGTEVQRKKENDGIVTKWSEGPLHPDQAEERRRARRRRRRDTEQHTAGHPQAPPAGPSFAIFTDDAEDAAQQDEDAEAEEKTTEVAVVPHAGPGLSEHGTTRVGHGADIERLYRNPLQHHKERVAAAKASASRTRAPQEESAPPAPPQKRKSQPSKSAQVAQPFYDASVIAPDANGEECQFEEKRAELFVFAQRSAPGTIHSQPSVSTSSLSPIAPGSKQTPGTHGIVDSIAQHAEDPDQADSASFRRRIWDTEERVEARAHNKQPPAPVSETAPARPVAATVHQQQRQPRPVSTAVATTATTVANADPGLAADDADDVTINTKIALAHIDELFGSASPMIDDPCCSSGNNHVVLPPSSSSSSDAHGPKAAAKNTPVALAKANISVIAGVAGGLNAGGLSPSRAEHPVGSPQQAATVATSPLTQQQQKGTVPQPQPPLQAQPGQRTSSHEGHQEGSTASLSMLESFLAGVQNDTGGGASTMLSNGDVLAMLREQRGGGAAANTTTAAPAAAAPRVFQELKVKEHLPPGVAVGDAFTIFTDDADAQDASGADENAEPVPYGGRVPLAPTSTVSSTSVSRPPEAHPHRLTSVATRAAEAGPVRRLEFAPSARTTTTTATTAAAATATKTSTTAGHERGILNENPAGGLSFSIFQDDSNASQGPLDGSADEFAGQPPIPPPAPETTETGGTGVAFRIFSDEDDMLDGDGATAGENDGGNEDVQEYMRPICELSAIAEVTEEFNATLMSKGLQNSAEHLFGSKDQEQSFPTILARGEQLHSVQDDVDESGDDELKR